MLDCGAHTLFNIAHGSKDEDSGKSINLDSYCDFVKDYGDKIDHYVAFDVIGDPAGTARNLDIMLDRGLRPVPIHVLGDGQDRMDELFEISDYVALGGMLRGRDYRLPRTHTYSYVKQKMQWAAGRAVHWFGFTRQELVPTYCPHSVDSSTWVQGQQYGQFRVYLGNGKWTAQVRYAKRHAIKRNPAAMRIAREVIPEFRIDDPRGWKHSADDHGWVHEINCDGYVRYVIDLYRHFGTLSYAACSPTLGTMQPLLDAIERQKHRFGK